VFKNELKFIWDENWITVIQLLDKKRYLIEFKIEFTIQFIVFKILKFEIKKRFLFIYQIL
jgi:hypothetical protein